MMQTPEPADRIRDIHGYNLKRPLTPITPGDDLAKRQKVTERRLGIKLHAGHQRLGTSDVKEHEIPRTYQTHLFNRAKEGNVIGVLDTGTGKTLIAVMLMKHVCELPENNGKCCIFLVPTVPLVTQQANYVKFNSVLRVEKFHGGLIGEKAFDSTTWVDLVGKVDVIGKVD
jgi:superfamily II DNA or RNA helicase